MESTPILSYAIGLIFDTLIDFAFSPRLRINAIISVLFSHSTHKLLKEKELLSFCGLGCR